MAERLIECLVSRGFLTSESAEEALERQVLMGGALDTAMFELALVDEAAVLEAMADAYGLDVAVPADAARPIDPRALRALPEQWARKHRVAPLQMEDDGHTLSILTPAPADVQLVLRLGELLELTIRPVLAPEFRVEERLALLYGVEPDERHRALVVGFGGHLPASTPPPRADDALDFGSAVARLRDPQSRDEVARTTLRHLGRHLEMTSLFVVHDDTIEGWIGRGPGAERVPGLTVAIDPSSVFHAVLETRSHYLGPLADEPVHDDFLARLGRPHPRSVLIAPLRIRERTVALLYGDNGAREISARTAADVLLFLTHVQTAMLTLVIRRKAASFSQLPASESLEVIRPPELDPASTEVTAAPEPSPAPVEARIPDAEPPAPPEGARTEPAVPDAPAEVDTGPDTVEIPVEELEAALARDPARVQAALLDEERPEPVTGSTPLDPTAFADPPATGAPVEGESAAALDSAVGRFDDVATAPDPVDEQGPDTINIEEAVADPGQLGALAADTINIEEVRPDPIDLEEVRLEEASDPDSARVGEAGLSASDEDAGPGEITHEGPRLDRAGAAVSDAIVPPAAPEPGETTSAAPERPEASGTEADRALVEAGLLVEAPADLPEADDDRVADGLAEERPLGGSPAETAAAVVVDAPRAPSRDLDGTLDDVDIDELRPSGPGAQTRSDWSLRAPSLDLPAEPSAEDGPSSGDLEVSLGFTDDVEEPTDDRGQAHAAASSADEAPRDEDEWGSIDLPETSETVQMGAKPGPVEDPESTLRPGPPEDEVLAAGAEPEGEDVWEPIELTNPSSVEADDSPSSDEGGDGESELPTPLLADVSDLSDASDGDDAWAEQEISSWDGPVEPPPSRTEGTVPDLGPDAWLRASSDLGRPRPVPPEVVERAARPAPSPVVARIPIAKGAPAPAPAPSASPIPPSEVLEDEVKTRLAQLEHPMKRIRGMAREALAAMGGPALPLLAERFPGPLTVNPFAPEVTLPGFSDCGPLLSLMAHHGRDAHPHVLARLDSPDPVIRFFATYFYSAIYVPEAVPRLIQRLHDEEPRICMTAARTLFGYRSHSAFTQVVDHMHGRLQASSIAARRHAIYLIGLFRDVTAVPDLIEILDRKERTLLDVTEAALAEITKQRLGSGARKWRSWWKKNSEKNRVEWLIEGLASRDDAIRRSAFDELRAVTGKDFGYESDAPKRRREAARQQWLTWWHDSGLDELARM